MSKKHHKHHEEHPEPEETAASDDEISINLKDIGASIKNFSGNLKGSKWINKTMLTWALIIIIMALAFWVRAYSFNQPITDDWAKSTIEGNVKNSIAAQLKASRPDLPDSAILAEVETQYQQFYSQNKVQVLQQENTLSQQFKKEMRDSNGTPFLSDIDSYLWYSYAKWHERTGFFGDSIVNGQQWYSLRNGRVGNKAGFVMAAWFIDIVHGGIKVFNPSQDIMASAFFVTPIFMMLAVIPAFLFGRKIGGLTGGIIGAAMIATMPSILGRSITADNDYVTFFFPILILWLTLEALEAKTWPKRIIYGTLTGFSVAFFRMNWEGYWFTAGLVGLIAGIYIIYKAVEYVLRKRKWNWADVWERTNPAIIFIGIYLVTLIAFLAILAGLLGLNAGQEVMNLIQLPLAPINFVLGFKGAASGVGVGNSQYNYPLWPNVFPTVAELNPGSSADLVNAAGGSLFFWAAIIGIIALIFFKRNQDGHHYPFYGILLGIWFASFYYAGIVAIRFTALFAPVVAFSIAGLAGMVVGDYMKPFCDKLGIKIVNVFKFVAFMAFLIIFVINPMPTSFAISKGNIPMYDAAWEKSLVAINHDSPKSIITSWWDFGHWFQSRSDRSVTFDGGDQGTRIHWVGYTLLTSDEHEAVDILKMLNCGQEQGYNELLADLKDPYKTTVELKNLIRYKSKEEARTHLKSLGLSDARISTIMNVTLCDNLLPMYYITSTDMIGKAGVWAHFGGWNFTRAYFYYKLKNMPTDQALAAAKNDLGMTDAQANDVYRQVNNIFDETTANNWISPWPSYVTGSPSPCKLDNKTNMVQCTYNIGLGTQNGLSIVMAKGLINLTDISKSGILIQAVNPSTGTTLSQSTSKPAGVALATETGLHRTDMNDNSFPYDIVLYKDDAGNYQSLIMQPELTESLFTKLYFFNGKYTKYFKMLSDETDFRGQRIIVWKVSDPDALSGDNGQ